MILANAPKAAIIINRFKTKFKIPFGCFVAPVPDVLYDEAEIAIVGITGFSKLLLTLNPDWSKVVFNILYAAIGVKPYETPFELFIVKLVPEALATKPAYDKYPTFDGLDLSSLASSFWFAPRVFAILLYVLVYHILPSLRVSSFHLTVVRFLWTFDESIIWSATFLRTSSDGLPLAYSASLITSALSAEYKLICSICAPLNTNLWSDIVIVDTLDGKPNRAPCAQSARSKLSCRVCVTGLSILPFATFDTASKPKSYNLAPKGMATATTATFTRILRIVIPNCRPFRNIENRPIPNASIIIATVIICERETVMGNPATGSPKKLTTILIAGALLTS